MVPSGRAEHRPERAHDERLVSVVVPVRNMAASIGAIVSAVLSEEDACGSLEVIVVDDASEDDSAAAAAAAGAKVLRLAPSESAGNPGAARNRGAAIAAGDPIIFLDADCTPRPGWLEQLLAAHDRGESVVGGSIGIRPDLPPAARCDHYCSSYNVHPARPGGYVPNHSPANLSVRREVFEQTRGFTETLPVADGHEELAWQAEVQATGHRIFFDPAAEVRHENRRGISNLLRRNYRWGYSSTQAKATTGAARFPWLYRRPSLLLVSAFPLAFGQTAYIIGCWSRARVREPLLMLPLILLARFSYAAGLAIGAWKWLRGGNSAGQRPRWR